MTTPHDPGPGLVAELRDALQIEPEWRFESNRGVAWWPHEFVQRLWADEPRSDGGVPGCRIHVETDVLEVPEPSPHLDGLLAELMRHPPMAAFRHDVARRKVTLWSSLFLHDASGPSGVPRLAVAALLQATYAHLGHSSLTKLTGLPAARSAHPSSGARPAPDGLLRLVSERVAPAGEAESLFAAPAEILAAAGELTAGGAAARATPQGLVARLPFAPGGEDPLTPARSSLLQVRHDEAHPELGRGVFLRLFLPGSGRLARGLPLASVALRLNDLERRDPGFAPASLGSWCLEQSDPEVELPVRAGPARLCHVTFLPNYVRIGGLLGEAVADAGRRALWVACVFAGGGRVD